MDAVASAAAPLATALVLRAFPGARRAAALAIPLAAAGAALLAYSAALTGSAFTSTYARWSPLDHPGFGPDIGIGYAQGNNLFRAALQLVLNLMAASDELFGWPLACLVLAVIGSLAVPRWSVLERVTAATVVLQIAGYACYHALGLEYGPRYYATLWPVFLLFTVQGAGEVGRRLGDPGRAVTALGMALATIIGVATWWPARLATLVDYQRTPSDVSVYRAQAAGTDILVVPAPIRDSTDLFESLFNFNPLDLHAPQPLFARDGDWVVDGRLARAFPDRHVRRLLVTGIPHLRGTAPD